MSARQTRRLLIVAFVLSLLVHAIAVLFVRPYALPAQEGPVVTHVVHLQVMRIARVQTPPPATPPPTPVPTAAPAVAPHRTAPHRKTFARGTAPVSVSTPGALAAPRASPHPASTPSCARNDTPAYVAASPPPPDIPAAARVSGSKGGTADIRVVVTAAGMVAQASVTQSTGDSELDQIALAMARNAQYTPATHGCKPVASQYAFSVEFAPW